MQTLQQVYDRVAEHLLTQKERSRSYGGGCAYRGENGRMCAIGCLIEDDHYRSTFNSRGVKNNDVIEALELSGIDVQDRMLEMLSSLQAVHDECNDWESGLISVAGVYDLKPWNQNDKTEGH